MLSGKITDAFATLNTDQRLSLAPTVLKNNNLVGKVAIAALVIDLIFKHPESFDTFGTKKQSEIIGALLDVAVNTNGLDEKSTSRLRGAALSFLYPILIQKNPNLPKTLAEARRSLTEAEVQTLRKV